MPLSFIKTARFCLMVFISLSLTACAARGPGSNFKAQYYPECYDPVEQMCKDASGASEAKGAAWGAAGGALLGALLGAASGDARNIAKGAVAGAVAGGVVGATTAHLSKISDQNKRLAALQQELGSQGSDLDLKRASAEVAYKCYRKQINLLKRQIHDKVITKREAEDRRAEIKAGLDVLKQYWAERASEYDSSLAEYDSFMAAEAKKAATPEQKQRVVSANRQVQRHRKNVGDNLKSVQKQQQAAEAEAQALFDQNLDAALS